MLFFFFIFCSSLFLWWLVGRTKQVGLHPSLLHPFLSPSLPLSLPFSSLPQSLSSSLSFSSLPPFLPPSLPPSLPSSLSVSWFLCHCLFHSFHLLLFLWWFPSLSLAWWLTNVVSLIIMTVISEWLSWRSDMKVITLLGGNVGGPKNNTTNNNNNGRTSTMPWILVV